MALSWFFDQAPADKHILAIFVSFYLILVHKTVVRDRLNHLQQLAEALNCQNLAANAFESHAYF